MARVLLLAEPWLPCLKTIRIHKGVSLFLNLYKLIWVGKHTSRFTANRHNNRGRNHVKNSFMKPFFAVTALLLLTLLACAPVSSERWYDSERSDRPGDVFFKSRQAAQASSSSVVTSQGLSPNQIRVRDGDSYYTCLLYTSPSPRD